VGKDFKLVHTQPSTLARIRFEGKRFGDYRGIEVKLFLFQPVLLRNLLKDSQNRVNPKEAFLDQTMRERNSALLMVGSKPAYLLLFRLRTNLKKSKGESATRWRGFAQGDATIIEWKRTEGNSNRLQRDANSKKRQRFTARKESCKKERIQVGGEIPKRGGERKSLRKFAEFGRFLRAINKLRAGWRLAGEKIITERGRFAVCG